MLRIDMWNKSVPRVELDQRSRDARLRLEQLERLLAPRAAVARSWLMRVVCLFSFGYGSRGDRTQRPLSNRRPSRTAKIPDVWLEARGSFYRTPGAPLYPAGYG
jgi:hypothetical protein